MPYQYNSFYHSGVIYSINDIVYSIYLLRRVMLHIIPLFYWVNIIVFINFKSIIYKKNLKANRHDYMTTSTD
jgi:hypothetical protein